MWSLNRNSVTSHSLLGLHGLSTTITQRRFGGFVHHYHDMTSNSPTWTHLQIVFMLPLSSINTTSPFFMISLFPNTSAYTPPYLHNIQETCIWLFSHWTLSYPQPWSHMSCFQTHACVQHKTTFHSTSLRVLPSSKPSLDISLVCKAHLPPLPQKKFLKFRAYALSFQQCFELHTPLVQCVGRAYNATVH